jgi:hypothetical protein
MKFMSARSSSFGPNDLAGASVETVHEIVQRAASKLSALQARRTHLRKRIQALLHISRTLANEAVTSRPTESKGSPSGMNRSDRAPLERNASVPRRSGSSALRRACRIALMETDHAESVEQILERIRKRNSVSLRDANEPSAAIVSELNRMLVDGEASRYLEHGMERWQLKRK